MVRSRGWQASERRSRLRGSAIILRCFASAKPRRRLQWAFRLANQVTTPTKSPAFRAFAGPSFEARLCRAPQDDERVLNCGPDTPSRLEPRTQRATGKAQAKPLTLPSLPSGRGFLAGALHKDRARQNSLPRMTSDPSPKAPCAFDPPSRGGFKRSAVRRSAIGIHQQSFGRAAGILNPPLEGGSKPACRFWGGGRLAGPAGNLTNRALKR
jgi:hypothetical protein